MGAIVTNPDNIGYFNPPNVYRPAIIDISIVGEYSSEDGATNTYRITQNDGKIFEFDVKNGSGGSAGRSVESVEQIQISTESLGKNIARITLSDGTYTDVEIRNGAQGETGPQGLRGPAGIDSVEASIGTNDPTQAPSVDKDLTEGVLSLTFNNIKGAKGDQGEPAVAVENYVTVEATSGMTRQDVLALLGDGSADTVYRVANWDGTQYDANAYTEYGWYDGAYKMLATRTPGIDDEPTAGSQKLVKSGGVAAQISQLGQEIKSFFSTDKILSIYETKEGKIVVDDGSFVDFSWLAVDLYEVVENGYDYTATVTRFSASGVHVVHYFNANMNHISYESVQDTAITDYPLTVPQNAKYIALNRMKSDSSTSIKCDVLNTNVVQDIENLDARVTTLEKGYKKILFFGDSITALKDTNGKKYSDYIEQENGCICYNAGIAGSTMEQLVEGVMIEFLTTPISNGSIIIKLNVNGSTKNIIFNVEIGDTISDLNNKFIASGADIVNCMIVNGKIQVANPTEFAIRIDESAIECITDTGVTISAYKNSIGLLEGFYSAYSALAANLNGSAMVEGFVSRDLTLQSAAAQFSENQGYIDAVNVLQSITPLEIDVVVFAIGTNDYDKKLGNEDDTDITMSGMFNSSIARLLQANPNLKIFLCTPIPRYFGNDISNWDDTLWGDNYVVNNITGIMKVVAQKIEDVGNHNHIPVCDLYWQIGWNKWNFSAFFNNNDGTHPQKGNGLKFIGHKIAMFLRTQ